MKQTAERLEVYQSNVFYNYTIGLSVTDVDLLKTAKKLLNSGLISSVCFSDNKCLYVDQKGQIQFEWIRLEGRYWDKSHKVNINPNIPHTEINDLVFCVELLFHEQRIEGQESRQLPSHFRAALPPIVLKSDDLTLPLFAWVKIFSDGIVILSFQLDTTWDGIGESRWISEIVNLFKYYFRSVFIDAKIQRLDANSLLPLSFHDEISIAGEIINNRKTKRLLKKMRQESLDVLDEALSEDGAKFEIGDKIWTLHEVAGSDQKEQWESTLDLCRSQYVNAIASQIVTISRHDILGFNDIKLWQGRPTISLMRFRDQPSTKDILLKKFSASMSRILIRSADLNNPPELPKDLRPSGDYCFHGNRSLLLWTWLRPEGAPDNAWDDQITRILLTENQARSEHFEYHNMRLARACSIAGDPPSYRHLIDSYETLSSAEETVYKSSQAGEITDALSYLMSVAGSIALIPSAKERARWKLDEFKYRFESRRTRIDRWIGFLFGLVGVTGFADLVIKPILLTIDPKLGNWQIGLFSFLISVFCVGLLAFPIWIINRKEMS